jgi:Ca2+-binding EF-hand superfamily protein
MSNLTEDKISEFREAFEMFDKDQDGAITIDELADLMRALNFPPTESEISSMKAEIDIDQNGSVDFKEFINIIARRVRDLDLEDEMVEAFRLFDTSHDGYVSKDELGIVMRIIGKYFVGEAISDEDLDKIIKETN